MSTFKGLSTSGAPSICQIASMVVAKVYAGVQASFNKSRHTSPVFNESLLARTEENKEHRARTNLKVHIRRADPRYKRHPRRGKRIRLFLVALRSTASTAAATTRRLNPAIRNADIQKPAPTLVASAQPAAVDDGFPVEEIIVGNGLKPLDGFVFRGVLAPLRQLLR